MTDLQADEATCVICKAQKATQASLCPRCNAGLCLFDDTPELLREAAIYLEAVAKEGPA